MININFSDYILTDETVRHEYGHYLQSRFIGPAYLLFIGVPSLFSVTYANITNIPGYHRSKWYEQWATREANKFFGR